MSEGYSDVIIGSQFGDEAKAKEADIRASAYDIVARFNGGANAGHTVDHNGLTIALQQIPSGVFYPEKLLYIGSGCIVNLIKLSEELESLKKLGLDVKDRLVIAAQTGVIQPHHLLIDDIAGGDIGTTKNGIGPAYADRATRMVDGRLVNIRMGDLLDSPDATFEAIVKNFKANASLYGFSEKYSIEDEISKMKSAFEVLAPCVVIDPLFLSRKVSNGSRVLFEGAQSFMLDVNKGSVPYVTSSNTVAAAAYIGGDLPAKYHRKTIGVAKVIMSRVGHGPFTSEFGGSKSEEYCMSADKNGAPSHGKASEAEYDVEALLSSENEFEMGKAIRILSGEYGTVTTRPRRVGALDLVQLSYAVKANGIDELVLTKVDLLNVFSRTKQGKIPVITGYELDGEKIDFVPGMTAAYSRAKPVIEYRTGFTEDISGVRNLDQLPESLQDLIKEVETFVGCKVAALGVGPGRDQYVKIS